MKKDIEIPAVDKLIMAVTEEYNELFKTTDHYVYLINKRENELEMVLILSSGSDQDRATSVMRHKIEKLPPLSFARVELMQEEILDLTNHFKVSFFENNRLFEKDFTLEKNAFKEGALRHIKILNKRGIVLK